MAWYAYCLTEHQTLPNGTRSRRPFVIENVQGVNGAPVLSYPSGEFAVIVSEYDQTSAPLDQKAAIDHARVVSGCFRNSTVLPFRFGTIFETDDALRQAVRVNRRAFGVSVAKLRGKSEMHIKLTVTDGSLREALIEVILPDTVGGDYLSKLRVKASRERERQTKARPLSVQVHKLFNPLEEEASCKKVAPQRMLIDLAHLIDTTSVKTYQNPYTRAAEPVGRILNLDAPRGSEHDSPHETSPPRRSLAHPPNRQRAGRGRFCPESRAADCGAGASGCGNTGRWGFHAQRLRCKLCAGC